MKALDLFYGTLHFRVHSPDPSHLRWVEEFFVPHLLPRGGGKRLVEVRLKVDPALYRRWQEHPRGGGETAAFLLDSDVVRLPTHSSSGEGLTLCDPQYRAFYRVSGDRRRCTVLVEKNSFRIRTPLMRIVREYVMNYAHRGGGFFLHASSFLLGGRPVIVTGPKRAGKTTLLLFACHRGGGQYLANDRVLVRRSGGAYRLTGIPSIVSVRLPTLGFFPGLERKLREGGYHCRLSSGERPEDVPSRQLPAWKDRHLITPLQFCRLAGTVQVAEGRDPVVVLPRLTGEPGRFSLRRLSAEEGVEMLRHSLFGARHWVTSTPAFNLSGEARGPSAETLARRCRAFIDERSCLLCEIGTDLYRREENAREWAGALLQAAR